MNPYLADIRLFAGNFAPRNNAMCAGQILPISQNETLYSLLNTAYGGDGRSTYALPDMRGRLPMHQGQGPGLQNRIIGSRFGEVTHVLKENEMPSHTHHWQGDGSAGSAGTNNPGGAVVADVGTGNTLYEPAAQADKLVDGPAGMVLDTGGDQAHSNGMPSLCLSFIIAIAGVYPSRN